MLFCAVVGGPARSPGAEVLAGVEGSMGGRITDPGSVGKLWMGRPPIPEPVGGIGRTQPPIRERAHGHPCD